MLDGRDIAYLVIVVLIVVALVIMFVYASRRRQAAPAGKGKYDERQVMVRGKAYQYGFFTLLITMMLYMMVQNFFDFELAYLGSGICMFFGIGVFAIYSIVKDAFFSLNEKPKPYLGICIVVALMNGLAILGRFVSGEAVSEWINSPTVLNLLIAVLFVVIALTIVIKQLAARKEDAQ